MFRFVIILAVIAYLAVNSPAQSTCLLPDSTYWTCADSGRLSRVCPESTVTVQASSPVVSFTAVHFHKSCRYGWAGGDAAGQVVLVRTTDGGRHWQRTLTPVMPEGDRVERISAVGDLLVYALLRSGRVLRSHDWGCTYMQIVPVPVAGLTYENGRRYFEESLRRFGGRGDEGSAVGMPGSRR
ncbi:MAG TPA: hypothetical protein DCY27_10990 [Desulfobacterales bacterium]|nr:hypothetical protein [Desulfobacterales bacterium]